MWAVFWHQAQFDFKYLTSLHTSNLFHQYTNMDPLKLAILSFLIHYYHHIFFEIPSFQKKTLETITLSFVYIYLYQLINKNKMTESEVQTNQFLVQGHDKYKSNNNNLQESTHVEPIVQSDYNNHEILRIKIRRYQEKIREMQKLSQRQKKQNDHLKEQLKQLNSNLTTVLQKVNPKNKKEKQENEQKKSDVTKKELDITLKQNSAYQKQIIALKARLEAHGLDRINKLENQLKEKDNKIQQLSTKIKLLEKNDKIYQLTDVNKLNQQLTSKISSQSEQIVFLKKKLAEQKKQEQANQKTLKRNHEQILSLESKLKESQNPNTQSQMQKALVRQVIPDISQQTAEIKKLHQNIASLENAKSSLEKKYKTDLDIQKTRIRSLEEELLELKEKYSNKQKENHIINSKMNELKRKIPSTLEPFQKNLRKSLDITQTSFETRKESKGLMNSSQSNKKFDDSVQLGIQKTYKISKMIFMSLQEYIISLTTEYELSDGSKKIIKSFEIENQNTKNLQRTEIEFSGYQYINSLQGLCNKHIQFLKITTSRGTIYKIGSDKNSNKCKKFAFDIKTNQKPIAVLGIIDHKKIINGEFNDVLISFGLQIKRKEVHISKQPSLHSGLNKISLTDIKKESKSSFQDLQKHPNDKNIIRE